VKFTGKRRITTAVAAGTVAVLALLGGTYATFVTQDTAPGQAISSATSSLTFTDIPTKQTFGSTYSKLAAGDSVVSFVDLKNEGTNSLENFRISQASTEVVGNLGGKATLESAGGEGLSVKIERVDGFDVVMGTQLATTKLANLDAPAVAIPLTLARDAVAHLKFTVTLDQAAVVQDQSLSTIYTVDANQVVAGAGGTPDPPGGSTPDLTGTRDAGSLIPAWTAVPGATSYTLNRVATTVPNDARFDTPGGVAVATDGTAYVADYYNHAIRKITPTGVVTTLAGSVEGFLNGTGSAAQFRYPMGVAVDLAGVVYVADSNNHQIRKITPDGEVTSLAGDTTVPYPNSGTADGTGAVARFAIPGGVAVATDGTVYVADTSNNRIRKITPQGVVSTLAGSVRGADNGTGDVATFDEPRDVAVATDGTVYVADKLNHQIRKLTTVGVVTTVTTLAGTNIEPGGGFANGAGDLALFSYPEGVAIGPDGNIYVSDGENSKIRKITPEGDVSTLYDDLGVEDMYPEGIEVAADGTAYVADSSNNRVSKITTGGVMTVLAGGGLTGWAYGYAETGPVTVVPSVVYTGPNLAYTDTDVVAGTSYTYTVTANPSGAVSNTIGPFLW